MQREILSTTRNDRPLDDQIVVLHGATWGDYQRMLEIRGDRSLPRLAYLEGDLELMNPSRYHGGIKSLIGCLVEVWCLERGVDFSPFGSWTLENKEARRGVEPDECYVFGTAPDLGCPDLAIEVVWTTGGLNKLEIYKDLGVREVWYWQRGRISIHVLRQTGYAEAATSEVLNGIDVTELASFLDRPVASHAIRDYRAALRSRGA